MPSDRCKNCESRTRLLWPPGRKPDLLALETGSWIDLRQCQACGALWSGSPYEPYASFEYLVLWPADRGAWVQAHAVDDGQLLLRWHGWMIHQHWRALSGDDLAAVEQHRRRAPGNNPVDAPPRFDEREVLNPS